MNLRHLSMILMFGLTGSAFGQDAQPATVYKLRNVAAADVAKSVTGYAAQKKLTVTVVAEPVSNAVFVSGDAEQQKRVVKLMTSLDKQLPTVLVSAMVVEVPLGFAEDVGLGDGDKWVLTARETRMLVAAIHREKSAKKRSEPKMIVTDNKLAFFRGGSEFEGYEASITPRISPDNDSILLRVEAVTKIPSTNGTACLSLPTVLTESVPIGGTLAIRCRQSTIKTASTRDVLILVTPERIASTGK